jgi:hypothetical protein
MSESHQIFCVGYKPQSWSSSKEKYGLVNNKAKLEAARSPMYFPASSTGIATSNIMLKSGWHISVVFATDDIYSTLPVRLGLVIGYYETNKRGWLNSWFELKCNSYLGSNI